MKEHFEKIAQQYCDLRTTDEEPILRISQHLGGRTKLSAADIGCGAGRYVLKLFQHLGPNLFLYCVDAARAMLIELTKYLTGHQISSFATIHTSAPNFPLPKNSLDFITTFNAVHHFDINRFLAHVSRVLKPEGHLFIYTRLRSQNANNIWGKYFPGFTEKENRLFELSELYEILEEVSNLFIHSVEFFRYEREASLDVLVGKARNHHYSTFGLYQPLEFEKALDVFINNIKLNYSDLKSIKWTDENVMFIAKKK